MARPGPKPSMTHGRDACCACRRCRMNRTVGEDMLPNADNTSRETASCGGASGRDSAQACRIRGPPGWTAQEPMCRRGHLSEQGDRVRLVQVMQEQRAEHDVAGPRQRFLQDVGREEVDVRHTGRFGSLPSVAQRCGTQIAPGELQVQTAGLSPPRELHQHVAATASDIQHAQRHRRLTPRSLPYHLP